jgi:hypothetical protein
VQHPQHDAVGAVGQDEVEVALHDPELGGAVGEAVGAPGGA